jgi:hypothetical protein
MRVLRRGRVSFGRRRPEIDPKETSGEVRFREMSVKLWEAQFS